MMPNTSNPTRSFYKIYFKDLNLVRESLFREVDKIAPELTKEIRTFYSRKLNQNGNKLPLGELFPWIIKDLINLDRVETRKVSLGWFALYVYTLFLDDQVDSKQVFNPISLLAGSALAKIALTNLITITKGTKYEGIVNDSLNESLANQLRDVKYQSNKLSLKQRAKYSAGKNKVLLACAGALASCTKKHSDFILKFTNSLLLAFQYLDDVGDYEDDLSNSNYTVLLYPLIDTDIQRFFDKSQAVNSDLLLTELINNGSLLRVTKEAQSLLSSSLVLLEQLHIKKIDQKASYQLFSRLNSELSILINSLALLKSGVSEEPTKYQKKIIGDIKRQLPILAQST